MIVLILINKLKSFLLIFVHIFNRALCCIRRRRRSSSDSIPLTHIGVVPNNKNSDEVEFQNWTDWNDEQNKPKTVQDHIELYRKQKVVAKQEVELPPEQQLNFFEDMAPQITRQTKLLINSDHNDNSKTASRLGFSGDSISLIPSSELGEWEESQGWEGETLDWVAQEALREKKKQEREKRAWEQQQKRQERVAKPLGSRVGT